MDEYGLAPDQLGILAGLIAARVAEIQAGPDPWMDRAAVMEHAGLGGTAITRAMNGGHNGGHQLHHHRPGDRGHPRTKSSVVDAWLCGANVEQQRQVCGCPTLHRWTPGK